MDYVKKGSFFARQGWYPADKVQCERAVEKLGEGESPLDPQEARALRAGVVHHDGWAFSGAPAAQVFKALESGETVDRLVLLGGHMGPHAQGWILTEGVFRTPLGEIEGDPEFAQALLSEVGGDFSPRGPRSYEPDNTIELQLPFVKRFMKEAKMVVAGVPATPEGLALGATAAKLARDHSGRTVFVGSTDLTHYGVNYGFMPKGLGPEAVKWVKEENDKKALDRLQALEAEAYLDEALRLHYACCPGASGAAVVAARELGREKGHLLDYYTSYDVHPGASFVGYAAVVM